MYVYIVLFNALKIIISFVVYNFGSPVFFYEL